MALIDKSNLPRHESTPESYNMLIKGVSFSDKLTCDLCGSVREIVTKYDLWLNLIQQTKLDQTAWFQLKCFGWY